jgi:hypothetical protein
MRGKCPDWPGPRRVLAMTEWADSRARSAPSKAGAPLSWTIVRADMLFVCERSEEGSGQERQPQRAERAMYTARQLDPGSRAAVLRRSEQTRLSSASEDEVGGLQSAIRAEQGWRAAVLDDRASRHAFRLRAE